MSYRRKASRPSILGADAGTAAPAPLPATTCSNAPIACRIVVAKRSSSTATTRDTASSWETSSGKAAFMRATTSWVSGWRKAPSMPSFCPWRMARRMILRRT